jgi:hypothetical protein
LQTLVFPLNGGKDQALVVERQGDGSRPEQALPLETQVVMKTAEIRYSLFGASDAAGIPDSVATQLADIFGGDIDFHRDLRKGDRFAVIYESVNYLGRPVRSGRILAAEFVNGGKTYRAAWFADPAGGENSSGYYTADGKNIRKAFLRSPLEFSRITSGFTSARFHPVCRNGGRTRASITARPVGTRVKATGNGTVEYVGVQGGYGKVVDPAPPEPLHHALWPPLGLRPRPAQGQPGQPGRCDRLRRRHRDWPAARTCITNSASTTCIRIRWRWPCPAPRPDAPAAWPVPGAHRGHLARLDLIRGFNLAQATDVAPAARWSWG